MNIDYEKLRKDLIDYFGSAMPYFGVAMIEVSNIERASNEELVRIANKNHFDLSKYKQKINSIKR